MTVGEALKDTSTNLGRAVAEHAKAHAEQIEAAQAIADRDGITLSEALLLLWNA